MRGMGEMKSCDASVVTSAFSKATTREIAMISLHTVHILDEANRGFVSHQRTTLQDFCNKRGVYR